MNIINIYTPVQLWTHLALGDVRNILQRNLDVRTYQTMKHLRRTAVLLSN